MQWDRRPSFAGKLVDWARTILATVVHVERTLAWLTAHRRLARDYERDATTSEAMIRWAAINTMTSRIARGEPATRQQRRQWPDES